jgi:large subunit ribosomal protein L3
MKFILAKKLHMTQVFDKEGRVLPVTVLEAGPITVTQVKTKENDGYQAVQIGFGTQKESRINKPLKGHMKGGSFKTLKEFITDATYNVGDKIDVTIFKEGESVSVAAQSKGKGFQGVVKRHGFGGGRRTHGQKHSEREPGTISGAGRAGGRVAPGMRMAGRMGGDRINVKNLSVAQVQPESNLLLVVGAIPGRRGTLVEVIGA